MASLELTTTYETVTCGEKNGGCSVQFAMTTAFYREMVASRRTWYCPNGHPRVFTSESPEAKLRRAEAREVALKDQLEAAAREAENTRLALLRDRQRFANGVCPCCNRSFDNVRRHMASKHPDYDPTKIAENLDHVFSCSCGRKFATLRGLRTHQGHARGDGWELPNAPAWRAHLTRI